MSRMSRRATVAAAAVIGLGFFAIAGDLNPPAGPVAPTMKTLDEVEPRTAINLTNTPGDADSVYRITASGSYYLTGNITGQAGKSGIEIATSGVSIDLNGFALIGVPGSVVGVVTVGTGLRDIAVRNGAAREWGTTGVFLTSANSIVSHVTASNNNLGGIAIGATGLVESCGAYFNGSDGISVGNGCTVVDSVAGSNGASGIAGQFGVTVRGCSGYSNTGHGIAINSNAVITECAATSNGANGVHTASACQISSCSATGNGGHGIVSSNDGMVINNTCRTNVGDGINAGSNNSILNNNCGLNGFSAGDGAGIHTTNSDNRIEGNNCADNDRGIDVDFTGSMILRNTCSGNSTNYDIAANNRFGEIVSIPASGTGAVLGSSAAGTLTTTDPWANFSY
ncbi:MAG: right-handed parallel beta-helix repeat-containing protein [Phycisphaerales bacterium]